MMLTVDISMTRAHLRRLDQFNGLEESFEPLKSNTNCSLSVPSLIFETILSFAKASSSVLGLPVTLSTSPSVVVDRFVAVVSGATSSGTATAADIVVKREPNIDTNNSLLLACVAWKRQLEFEGRFSPQFFRDLPMGNPGIVGGC